MPILHQPFLMTGSVSSWDDLFGLFDLSCDHPPLGRKLLQLAVEAVDLTVDPLDLDELAQRVSQDDSPQELARRPGTGQDYVTLRSVCPCRASSSVFDPSSFGHRGTGKFELLS